MAWNNEDEIFFMKGIWVKYYDVEALKDISLGVTEGNIVTLLGANGAGKTTALNTISGINIPVAGEIWFQGERIDRLAPDKIVKMGIAQVPEGRRIFPQLTVRENLEMGAYVRKNIKEVNCDLKEVTDLFPILEKRYRQPAGTLSGGEQQMLAFGRAMMSHPKLLLLDEPTMGLSPLICKLVGEIILTINQRGGSILLVEQNARMALKLASKGFVMETGRIVLQGSAEELIGNALVKKAYLGGLTIKS